MAVAVSGDKIREMAEKAGISHKNLQIPVSTEHVIKLLKSKEVNDIAITVTLDSSFLNDKKMPLIDIKMPKEMLQAAAAGKKDISLTVRDEKGGELYTWSFHGRELNKNKKDIKALNLSLSVEKVAENLQVSKLLAGKNGKGSAREKGVVISFRNNGILPAQAAVKIYIGAERSHKKDKEKAYVYYYNARSKKLDALPYSSGYKVDSSGFLTIQIKHCSDYVVLPEKADKSFVTALSDQIKVTPEKTTLSINSKTPVKIKMTLPGTLEQVTSFAEKTSGNAVGALVVTYRSANPRTAAVTSKGEITAKGKGTAVILTTIKLYNGETKTFQTKITVK